MKKLAIMAFTVAIVTVTQAASILWGGDVCAPDGVTPVGEGSVAYLIRGGSDSAAAITKICVVGTDYTTWTTDTGAEIVAAYTLSSVDASTNFRFAPLKTVSGVEDAGFYSVVLVNGSAGADGLKGSYNYLGENTFVDPTSGTVVDLTISDGWTSKWIGNNGFDSVSFTPEPTSGLLFALGFAGLALRRKRA